MKNILFKVAGILSATTLLATGCIKEYVPEGSTQTAAQVAANDDALSAMVNGVSVSMMASGTAGYYSTYGWHTDFGIGAIQLMTEYMLDDMVTMGSNPYYNRFYQSVLGSGMDTRYAYPAYYWDCYYQWIKAANDIINLIDPATATDITRGYLGQAYAYRASFYLDLARLYEPRENKYTDISAVKGLTVPIVTEKTTEQDAKNNPRVTHDVLYKFILDDLDLAEQYLDGTSYDYTTPNATLVDGLRARAYLEMGSFGDAGAYEKAYEAAKKVMDNADYAPLTQAQWEDPSTGFNDGGSNKAWIWGLTCSDQIAGNITCHMAHICNEGAWGYAPLAQIGINKSLYERIPDTDWRKHSWLDPKFMDYYQYKFADSDQTAFLNGTGSYSENDPAKPYESIKFRPAQGNTTNYTVGNSGDLVLMRVEEMYFIAAEALANMNRIGEAQQVLNSLIQTRNSSYDCSSFGTLKSFLDEMLFQKKIEFWGEGILMYDYKRLNESITRGYDGTNEAPVYAYNSTGRSPLWTIVITRSECQNNNGIPQSLNNPDPTQKLTLWSK